MVGGASAWWWLDLNRSIAHSAGQTEPIYSTSLAVSTWSTIKKAIGRGCPGDECS